MQHEQYLEHRRNRPATAPSAGNPAGATSGGPGAATRSGTAGTPSASPAATRQARKDMARIEQQLTKQQRRLDALHTQMAEAATDYVKLADLQKQAGELETETGELEAAWLEAAELAE